VKTNESVKKLWKFKFTVNQIYCTIYFILYKTYILQNIYLQKIF